MKLSIEIDLSDISNVTNLHETLNNVANEVRIAYRDLEEGDGAGSDLMSRANGKCFGSWRLSNPYSVFEVFDNQCQDVVLMSSKEQCEEYIENFDHSNSFVDDRFEIREVQ